MSSADAMKRSGHVAQPEGVQADRHLACVDGYWISNADIIEGDLVGSSAGVRQVELVREGRQCDIVRHCVGRIRRLTDDGVGAGVYGEDGILAAAGQVGGVEVLPVEGHTGAMRTGGL